MRHLLDIRDLSLEEIDQLLDRAEDIIENPKKYSECMHGKKLATLFFEPSTRTRLSFEAAMMELGGLDNLTIGCCGDLKYGRTVHSLISAMSRYKNIKVVLISPEELRLPACALCRLSMPATAATIIPPRP